MTTIRPTVEADFPAIAALTNEFIVGSAVHFGYEPVTDAELRGSWVETRERYPWLTAEVGGEFGGYAKAGSWRTRAAYQWSAEVGVYVCGRCRGAGVGSALYRELLDELRRRGFHSAIGGVTLPNDASVRLHERVGFTHVGTFRHAGYKLGAWHDVGFWQVMLHGAGHAPARV